MGRQNMAGTGNLAGGKAVESVRGVF
jgi:hypothetical protein